MKWIFVLEPALCQIFSLLLLLYNFRGGKRKFDTLCGCVESSGPTTWQQHTEYNFTTTVTKCHIWVFLKCETVIVTLRVSDWQWESDLGGTRNSCDVFDNDDNLIIMMRMTTTMMMIVTTWFTLIFLSSFRYSRAWSFMRPIVLYRTDIGIVKGYENAGESEGGEGHCE